MTVADLNLAVYLDEAGDDPLTATEVVREANLKRVCLRQVWYTPLPDASDLACERLHQALSNQELTVAAIHTGLGAVPANQLRTIDPAAVKRSLAIGAYFKARYSCFYAGRLWPGLHPAREQLDWWLDCVAEQASAYNSIPLLELDYEAYLQTPTELAVTLKAHPAWRLLYDPANLIIKKNQDPFLAYWALFRDRIAACDLRDYAIGKGFRPIGQGDCRWQQTLTAAGLKGEFFLEPSLGRRYGSANSFAETLDFSIQSLALLLSRIQLTPK